MKPRALREAAQLIARLDRSDPGDLDPVSLSALERLVALLATLEGPDVEALRPASPTVAAFYRRYVGWKEAQEASALIERGADRGSLERGEGGDFAGRSYARVRDLFERIDFGACREFVMVGCGPLPVTLLHVARRTRIPRIVGLDADEGAIRRAEEICGRMAPSRIEVLLRNGCDHDYGRADAVYLANLVHPKASVLARVAETARPGAQVIVREPFAAGILLAERGLDPRDRRFKLLGRGPGDPRFLSHHVFLARTPERGR